MIKILNLGAGLQSSILLLLSERGELPKLDLAIFSDTQYEPHAVYDHLEWLKSQVTIPVVTVTNGNLRDDVIEFRQNKSVSKGKRYANIPFFLKDEYGIDAGKVRRQCTSEYKIIPIEKYIKKEVLGLSANARWPKEKVVEQWFGITTDESRRMAYPGIYTNEVIGEQLSLLGDGYKEVIKRKKWRPAHWRENVYPFINSHLMSSRKSKYVKYFYHTWTRHDCQEWAEHYYQERQFPRSACICCPFRNDSEWLQMKNNNPKEWQDAVDFDKEIRKQSSETERVLLRGTPFIHKSRMPLDIVDLNPNDKTGFSCGTLYGDTLGSDCGT